MDREKRMTEGAELEFTFGRASGSRQRMPSTKQEFALKGPSIKRNLTAINKNSVHVDPQVN